MIKVLTIFAIVVVAGAAAKAADDKPDKSLFDRTHEAIERAERAGNVGGPERPAERPQPQDRGLINNSERQQMQRLENENNR